MTFNFLAQKRIAKDIKNYIEGDINDVGIYCHIDESDITDIKALIIGPPNTPYENGFYLFNINFPNDYPFNPPKVKFVTHEIGVRFNPNLYTNGKVCLSILGTWSGPGWTTCLNLNTVLLSIQSLLNENPIINEPGFENEIGTKAKNYASIINYFNIKIATIKMLENPPTGFEVFKDIMIKHFIKNIDYYRTYLNENKDNHASNIFSNIYSMNTIMDIQYIKEHIEELYSKYNDATINVTTATTDTTTAIVTTDTVTTATTDTNINDTINDATINNVTAKKKYVRKSPIEPAKMHDIGYTKVSENDGKIWKVIEVVGPKKTIKRWTLVN
jgi:ubiquitin-conjugating enzyme E2 Z